MKIATIQMAATDRKSDNLRLAEELIYEAVRQGAELVVLPEHFSFRGGKDKMADNAEPLFGPTLEHLSFLAKSNYVMILAGTILEKADGVDKKFYNTSVLLDQNGHQRLVYRKVHLFDVNIGRTQIRESETFLPGNAFPVEEIDRIKLGCLVCYDIRFPAAAHTLRVKGMDVLLLPSNFLAETGRKHWEILLRARAIENGIYVIAANQYGINPVTGHESYGRSMIVDPTGQVVEQKPSGDAVILREISTRLIQQAREEIPTEKHRRPDLYQV